MEYFLALMAQVYELLNMKMDIYGFTFSFWDIIMFGLIVTALFGFVRHMFYEN